MLRQNRAQPVPTFDRHLGVLVFARLLQHAILLQVSGSPTLDGLPHNLLDFEYPVFVDHLVRQILRERQLLLLPGCRLQPVARDNIYPVLQWPERKNLQILEEDGGDKEGEAKEIYRIGLGNSSKRCQVTREPKMMY